MAGRVGVSGLAAETAATIKAHRTVFVTLAAAFLFLPQLAFSLAAPQLPLGALGGAGGSDGGAVARLPGWFWPTVLLLIVVQLMYVVPVVRITLGLTRANETVGDMVGDAARRLPRYLLALLLLLAVYIAVALAVAVPAGIVAALALGGGMQQAAGGGAQSPAALAVLLLALLPVLLWLAARMSVWFSVFVAEDAGPVGTLKRTWALTRGHAGRIALLLIGLFAVYIVASLLVGGLGAALGVTGEVVAGHGLGAFLSALANAALSAAFGLFFTVLLAHLYRRLRAVEPRADA